MNQTKVIVGEFELPNGLELGFLHWRSSQLVSGLSREFEAVHAFGLPCLELHGIAAAFRSRLDEF